ncbi:DUF937 domain-containing protein [Mesorhizobium sp. NBSH29]|uniref:DUF937 domain-containing protein n=1 Tax=Mesorhizobium sp. NBSH29 TaxID=2654249 RepID=UPI0018966CE5|nr:DUF937 domain-containing protein [Mesorhizobium sp. NBSH29]QPC86820.1 DUF937 domain-containing protein [Mesorhizobium sp. NBSH29]
MLPLFEMLTNAQNGQGMAALAKQFNLTPQQTEQAVAALVPAFSQGLKRNTADPQGMGSFMAAMTSGKHAQYFDDPAKAVGQQGLKDGKGILGHLFGSKDLSRAVAGQAAQASGVGQDVLKQMLPAVASMLMGGLFKQSTGQMQAASASGAPSNPLGEIIGQMMRQAGGATQQSQAQPHAAGDNPLGKMFQDILGGASGPQPGGTQVSSGENPLGKIFEQMMGGGKATPGQAQASVENPLGKMIQDMFGGAGGQAQSGQQAPGSAAGENPLGKIFEQMMGGGQQQAQAPASPQAAPRNPLEEMLGKMFDPGAKQPGNYQKGVESIFEQFTKGMDRPR